MSDSYIFGNHGTLHGDAALIGLDQVSHAPSSGVPVQVPCGTLDASGNP